MKPIEGAVYCWTVWYGPRKWKSFRNRKEARAFRAEVNGVLFQLRRVH
jgi:hypothetical protein